MDEADVETIKELLLAYQGLRKFYRAHAKLPDVPSTLELRVAAIIGKHEFDKTKPATATKK